MAINVKCPHCNRGLSAEPVHIVGQGYNEQQYRQGNRSLVSVRVGAEYTGYAGHIFYILDCSSCGRTFFVADQGSGPRAVWPLPIPEVADELPEEIAETLSQAYRAASTEAWIACLLVCKTTLERIWRRENAKRIDDLIEQRKLSAWLRDQAHEVRHLANVVDHEDIELGAVGQADCEEMLEFVRALAQALYVEPERVRRASERRRQIRETPPAEDEQ